MRTSTVLVTGHSGLIGSHLIQGLLFHGHTVHGISKTLRNQVDGCINHYFDMRDRKKAFEVIKEIKPEIVFANAANAAENLSTFSPIEITTSNYDVFWNTLVPAINGGRLRRVIFTSSIAVYGAIHIPFRESDLPLPQDIYGITKLAIEHALRIMSDVHGFEYVVVRPHNVYGENQRMDDPYRNVIALWMNQLLKKEPYTIYGDGTMRRCFSYVRDIISVMMKCAFQDVAGMTFNVGSDNFYELKSLSDLLQKISGVNIEPKYLPTRIHEVHTAVSDHTLVKKVLGYYDTPIEQALRNMWNWAQKIGPQVYKFSDVEIESDRLPKNWQKKGID